MSSTSSWSAGPSSAAAAARHTNIQSAKAGSSVAFAASRARSYATSAGANSPFSSRASASGRAASAVARRASGISAIAVIAVVVPRLVGLHLLERDELANFAARLVRREPPSLAKRRVVDGGRQPIGCLRAGGSAASAEGSSKKLLMDSSNT